MCRVQKLLLEMSVVSETEVFTMDAVASVSTDEVVNMEGDILRDYIYKKICSIWIPQDYTLDAHDVGAIIRHHCGFRPLKKAALLTLPYVINANHITVAWKKRTDEYGAQLKGKDKRLSGMISAPIFIDGTKYLCNLTLKKGLNGKITPYALTLKDASGNIIEGEKMDSTLQVPDSNGEPTTNGNAHLDKVTTSPDANPSTSAKVVKEFKIDKNMKRKINESQLRAIVSESVKRVLMEMGNNDYGRAIDENDFHRAYKRGKNLDVLHTPDGTYREEDLWTCLSELKDKLREVEKYAKMPQQFGNDGEARNYLVGAIRGLQAFIDSRK